MDRHIGAISALASEPWICERCGCQQDRACRIEIMVTRPNGERAMLFADECDWSAPGLCTACDERLLPELKSLLEYGVSSGQLRWPLECLTNKTRRPQESGNPRRP